VVVPPFSQLRAGFFYSEASGLDAQTLFNGSVSVIILLGGYVLNSIRGSLDRMSDDHRKITDRVTHIDVMVARDYVQRGELDAKMDKIENKIDRLAESVDSGFRRVHDRLDDKADK
jgi:hypothetical protein